MKSYTKGAKRRNKAKLPELAKVPGKKKRGGARMREIAQDESRPNLAKRARDMGHDNINASVLARMASQALTDAAGRALVISEGEAQAKPLLEAYTGLSVAYERYCRTVLGLSPHAKSMKIEMMPDKMPDAMDYTPDLRSDDERAISAKRAWGEWSKRMDAIGLGHSSAIYTAMHGFVPLHEGRNLTAVGQRFVAAMQAIAATLYNSKGTF